MPAPIVLRAGFSIFRKVSGKKASGAAGGLLRMLPKGRGGKNFDVSFETNAKAVAKRVGKEGKELSDSIKTALTKTGLAGLQIIEQRTQDGKSFEGGNFKPYSTKGENGGYANWRVENGLSRKPNLEVSGNMLGSMTMKADSRKATLFFSRGTEAAKAAHNQATRPFFGFSPEEETTLAKVFFRSLK